MRHNWIFDVLTDLRSYAQKNDLPSLMAQVDETIRAARAEIGRTGPENTTLAEGEFPGEPPQGGQRH